MKMLSKLIGNIIFKLGILFNLRIKNYLTSKETVVILINFYFKFYNKNYKFHKFFIKN